MLVGFSYFLSLSSLRDDIVVRRIYLINRFHTALISQISFKMGNVNTHRTIFFRVFAYGWSRLMVLAQKESCEIEPNHFTAYVCLSVTTEEPLLAFS